MPMPMYITMDITTETDTCMDMDMPVRGQLAITLLAMKPTLPLIRTLLPPKPLQLALPLPLAMRKAQRRNLNSSSDERARKIKTVRNEMLQNCIPMRVQVRSQVHVQVPTHM